MDGQEIPVISIAHISSNEKWEKEKKGIQKNVPIKSDVAHLNVCYFVAIFGFCAAFTSSLTLFPRHNSIFYQTKWYEFNIPMAVLLLLDACGGILDIATFFNEKSLLTFRMLLRMYMFCMTLWLVPFLMAYIIWCNLLGYNWPIPYLGYNYLINVMLFPGVWYVFPYHLRCDKEFRKNMKMYLSYFTVVIVMMLLREGISLLFQALPLYLQWIVALLITLLKHFDKWLSSKLITRMTGGKYESSTVLLSVKINGTYSYFIAVRIFGAETMTVFFFIVIELMLQLHMTYQIIQRHNKVAVQTEKSEDRNRDKDKIVRKLVLAEMTEGITPVVFAIGFAMAYYGPNSDLLGNVKNDYWTYKKVEDAGNLFLTMLLLSAVDTFSMVINSLILIKFANISLYYEICRLVKKYWIFLAIRFGMNICGNYASNDINLGMDSTGEFQWITKEGRYQLINISKDLSKEEKMMLLLQQF